MGVKRGTWVGGGLPLLGGASMAGGAATGAADEEPRLEFTSCNGVALGLG